MTYDLLPMHKIIILYVCDDVCIASLYWTNEFKITRPLDLFILLSSDLLHDCFPHPCMSCMIWMSNFLVGVRLYNVHTPQTTKTHLLSNRQFMCTCLLFIQCVCVHCYEGQIAQYFTRKIQSIFKLRTGDIEILALLFMLNVCAYAIAL